MALGSVNVPGVSHAELEAVRLQAITATQNAEAAGNSAASAQNTANAALSAANTARDTADTAKTTAETAISAASAADTKATNAKSAADSALTTANAAKTAADNAAIAAANAQQAAHDAAQALTDLTSTINTIPSQAGTLYYTGSAQTPSWNGYDSEKMTISVTAKTDAGDYTATVTPKSGYKWPDGTNDAKTITWKIARAAVAVPTVSQNPTYTGSAVSPTWNGYDTGKMTLTSGGSSTNAGSVTAKFTIKANYCWTDGSTGEKSVGWSVNKAAGSLSISPTSLTIEGVNATKTIAVTRSGDGAITATSSNTSVATVSVNGTTVTVTGKASGTVTITIKVAAGTNHNAPSNKTCTATVSVPTIYGASWDGSSTTKWTRTDAAAGFTDPVPYTAGKTAAQCSSPFDNLQPWAGMVKSERTGGTMVAIPKFWYKLTQSGSTIKVQIADKATSGFSVSPAHMNRGDGKGERDVVYIGRYHCHTSDWKSKTGGKPKASVTRATARSSIHALGSNIWQADFAMRFTLWLLYIVEFADWNTQKTIGKGCGNNSGTENMGYTDSMPYHTGTTQSNRDTYGLGTQYRNIEGLWDNVLDWCDGCYNNSNGFNLILNPNNFSDSSGGTSVGTPCNGWPAGFTVSSAAGFPMFYGSKTGGSETTYSCDFWYFGTSYPAVCVGGYYSQDGNYGLFYVDCTAASHTYGGIGSRLQELP